MIKLITEWMEIGITEISKVLWVIQGCRAWHCYRSRVGAVGAKGAVSISLFGKRSKRENLTTRSQIIFTD